MSLFAKVFTTLFVIFLGLLIYGELTGNFKFVLAGGIPLLVGCVIISAIALVKIWTF